MTDTNNNETVYAWWSADLFKLYKICRCFGSVISKYATQIYRQSGNTLSNNLYEL
jgi:hypothetical protein